MNKKISYAVIVLSGALVVWSTDSEASSQDYIDGWIDGYLAGKQSGLQTGDVNTRRLYWAVAKTESNTTSTLPDGKIPIRYEPHIMARCLKRKGITKHVPTALTATVSHRKRKKNSYTYLRLAKQYGVSECGHWSTSYGKYQIMGFHHAMLGYASAKQMADAYHTNATDEYNFMQFIKFLKTYRKGKAHRQLLAYDFNGFAKTYNGSIKYARKLRENYKLAKLNIKD